MTTTNNARYERRRQADCCLGENRISRPQVIPRPPVRGGPCSRDSYRQNSEQRNIIRHICPYYVCKNHILGLKQVKSARNTSNPSKLASLKLEVFEKRIENPLKSNSIL